VKKFGHEIIFHADSAYEDDAKALVLMPEEETSEKSPVLLFLLGNGHVNDRDKMTGGMGLDVLLRNEQIRRKFITVVPKPTTNSGLVTYIRKGWQRRWSEDAVWSLFTEVLRRLGPEKADPARLYVTGTSLGATGTWNLAIKYGKMLAAVAPVSGRCDWPGTTWPGDALRPAPGVLENLSSLSMRAYQIDIDSRAGNPEMDIGFIAAGLQEKSRNIEMPGFNLGGEKCKVRVKEWRWKPKGATLELWWVTGPLTDCPLFSEPDNHCLWLRTYPHPQWGMASFFLRNQVPEERQWRFDSDPIKVDTSEEKAKTDAWWAEWDQEPDQWSSDYKDPSKAAPPKDVKDDPPRDVSEDPPNVAKEDGAKAVPP